MGVRACFPTLLYEAALGGPRPETLRRDLLDDCLKVRDHDAEGRAWCRKHYPRGFTSYASMGRLHRQFSTFMELERRLDRHAAAFARRLDWDLDGGRLKLLDAWVNVMPAGAAHSGHLHPLSVISGTYYVQTPPGCSELRFEDPRLDRFMAAPPRRKTCRESNRVHLSRPVRAGRLILFESWLRHEVPPNPARGERVSISFNYAWA
jgi:uncharacterized protein (TIGR02466 family)